MDLFTVYIVGAAVLFTVFTLLWTSDPCKTYAWAAVASLVWPISWAAAVLYLAGIVVFYAGKNFIPMIKSLFKNEG